MMRIARKLLPPLLIFFGLSSNCFAGLIAFDNMGASNVFSQSSYEGFGGRFLNAIVFESSASGALSLVEAPFLIQGTGISANVTLSLYENNVASIGALLDSSTVGLSRPANSPGSVASFGGWSASVVQGYSYWMVASAPDPERVGWNTQLMNPSLGLEYNSADGGATWNGPSLPASGLRVIVGNVPVPSTVWLLGLGLVGLSLMRRKKV